MAIKDKKHWATKSEAKHDEFKDALEQALDWAISRRREIGWAAASVAATAAMVGLFLYGRHARANAAWDKLSQAELYAYSGRPQDAHALLTQVAEQRGAPMATGMARLMEGDMHYPRGEYEQALAAYEKAEQEAPETLKPMASADKVMTLEAAGKNAECAASAQSFLDAHADHLLAPQVHVSLARCLMAQGPADAAKTTLQKISLQYPNTPWAEWANARLQPPAPASK